jgi:hypothetical protein
MIPGNPTGLLNDNILVPGSANELVPTEYLNAFLVPVDPYRKFRKEESLKSSVKECAEGSSCAPLLSITIAAIVEIRSFFIFV